MSPALAVILIIAGAWAAGFILTLLGLAIDTAAGFPDGDLLEGDDVMLAVFWPVILPFLAGYAVVLGVKAAVTATARPIGRLIRDLGEARAVAAAQQPLGFHADVETRPTWHDDPPE